MVYWNSNKTRVTDYTTKAQLDCYYYWFFLNHCYICNVSSLIYVVLDVQLICLFLNKYHHSTVRLGIFTKAFPIKNRTWQHTAATHPLDWLIVSIEHFYESWSFGKLLVGSIQVCVNTKSRRNDISNDLREANLLSNHLGRVKGHFQTILISKNKMTVWLWFHVNKLQDF